ncbi:MAG TPA: MurR/RpiR family transcriptional regulator [Solirubrobacteraceae bacterium]|nr:MurR/RpiR family transcriptional regulator [Solirubrobacteraceae bacterium]
MGPSGQLRAGLGELPDAERRVAELLLAHPTEAGYDSVGRLAERAGVSPATVVRLSRRMGYAGYAALKLAIAHEAGRADQFGYGRARSDSKAQLHQRVMADDAHSIRGGAQALDAVAFEAARAAIAGADQVMFAGVGASAATAALAAFRFSALGLRVSSAMDALVQHLHADNLRAGDVCVAISHTGESRDTIDVARAAAQAGAVTVGVTSSAGSPLTQAVQIALVCADQHDPAARELFANPVAIVSALGALHAGVAALLPAGTAPSAAARAITSHQY